MTVYSYNNWPAYPAKQSAALDLTKITAGGVTFPPGVRGGDVAVVFQYLVTRLNKEVEKAVSPGCWGYNFRPNRNANNLSCHASATAIDYNAPAHPNGKRGTWGPVKTAKVRQILADLDHIIRWGEDFHGTPDGMHFEINATPAAVKKVANKIRRAAGDAPRKVVPPLPPADPRLHMGTSGSRVADVQRALLKHGYSGFKVDGKFGTATDAALRAFQRAGKRNPDGITWAADWAALRRAPVRTK